MPVTIGAKPPGDFSNPIELLSDCHRRIERFLAVLVRVAAEGNGGEMTGEQRREWEQALDYFRNAAPRHTADEEESLFPRLRHAEQAEARKAFAAMQELETEHGQATEWHARVDEIGTRWLRENKLTSDDTDCLKEALDQLSELYRHHIAIEDLNVFPIASAALSSEEKADIGREMARRRGLDTRRDFPAL